MTPSDAVVLRAQASDGFERMRRAHSHRVSWDVRAMGAFESMCLSAADLYVWRSDLMAAASSAASALPLPVTMRSDLRPSPSGLYVFDRPVAFDGMERVVGGIGWAPVGDEHTGVWLYTPTSGTKWSDAGPLTSVAAFIVMDGIDVLDVRAGKELDWRRCTTDKDFHFLQGRESVVRFLVASWLWLKQSVMVADAAAANRVARKAAERAKIVSSVKVVVLRRRDGSAHRDSEGAREYDCQWLVRGHWRQQFYPSTGDHRPIWIEPYVKGPEDKPFRMPSQTVFSVSR